ncbi:cysteinyl-tRNA synthetase [Salpingoeca rosetta]|uniref:cysteine--tRNA ligase n=1 Tax=Salpingoeca rosetta (strain ATCC 50818 / BSB-021) TaxID=946362 RepID=F2U4J9_SALR5|nr:cysteinyl-tRNA synthetase [Salpingoeca rosetta]EGD82565.1 cysteinyl-tRNA synthetase [Salpingoeca rosetta]|eukprot:XP_004995801.1 cysteinyl-tRNA synthetase [Salpingoeca rosetta]
MESMGVPQLQLFNSYTRQKEVFVPRERNRVTWYGCGPTVYDASHMGHARAYITFDIMRRVLRDYFKYDCEYVMNITDLDDKIILRARQNHLFEQYIAQETLDRDTVLQDIKEALERLDVKIADPEEEPEKKKMYGKAKDAVQAATVALPESPAREDLVALCTAAKDPLSAILDKRKGSTVSDHSIFSSVSRKWEAEFHRDMNALNVEAPDVLKRVTECVPEIAAFVQRIIDNGYGYEANGSVYFDVAAFRGSSEHNYPKLLPEAAANAKALEEGEGALSSGAGDKRSQSDFALWKASKPGEPAWPSPWGQGRPGWHIECSVMASSVLNDNMDIHSGGVDLKFPHHDNECAQSEAYYGNDKWVNYFIHSGHLHIEGHKMSKSLKNFITIKEALDQYTARQIRLMFLLHNWKATLDYSSHSMMTAISYEKMFNEFFLNVSSALYGADPFSFFKPDAEDRAILQQFKATKQHIHNALCDSIDTPLVMQLSKQLITAVNVYIKEKEAAGSAPQAALLRQIGRYFTELLALFGVVETPEEIGFHAAGAQGSMEDAVLPQLLAFAHTREAVRQTALTKKDKAVLKMCDEIRDDELPNVGVRLEDKEQGPVVKLVDREILMQERERELAIKREKERKKAEAAAKRAKEEEEKREKAKMRPQDMFKNNPAYSQFNERGVPTHDKDGEPLPKSALKKLEKQWKAQDKLHKKYFPGEE